jgi:hypothetical protein
VQTANNQQRHLQAFMACQETAAEALAEHREAPVPLEADSSEINYYISQQNFRTAEQIEREFGYNIFTPYLDRDSGDLTIEHFAQHYRWSEGDDEAEENEELTAGYGNMQDVFEGALAVRRHTTQVTKTPRRPQPRNAKGQFVRDPRKGARWTGVRAIRPDSDE